MHVIARHSFSYNHRGIQAGEIFEVSADHGKVLLMAGSVKPVVVETPPAPEPVPDVPDPPPDMQPLPVKRKRGRPRKYARRDLQAED